MQVSSFARLKGIKVSHSRAWAASSIKMCVKNPTQKVSKITLIPTWVCSKAYSIKASMTYRLFKQISNAFNFTYYLLPSSICKSFLTSTWVTGHLKILSIEKAFLCLIRPQIIKIITTHHEKGKGRWCSGQWKVLLWLPYASWYLLLLAFQMFLQLVLPFETNCTAK